MSVCVSLCVWTMIGMQLCKVAFNREFDYLAPEMRYQQLWSPFNLRLQTLSIEMLMSDRVDSNSRHCQQ